MLTKGLAFDASISDHLSRAHNRPEPGLAAGSLLAREGASAVIDLSDGLVADLEKVCHASGVGAVIYADRIPADVFLKRAYPDSWLELALSGRGDYELLFTVPFGVSPRLDVPVSLIGETVEGPPKVQVLNARGRPLELSHLRRDEFSELDC